MKSNLYTFSGLAIYAIACAVLVTVYAANLTELIFVIAVIGIGFSSVAMAITKKIKRSYDAPAYNNEKWIQAVLLLWIVMYITFISNSITKFNTAHQLSAASQSLVVLVCKLSAFVAIPCIIYLVCGYTYKDIIPFSFSGRKRNILVFVVIGAISIVFQLFFSKGGQALRNGSFSQSQLLTGIPLCFIWLALEAGLVEEFFFRVIIQSKISAITRSGRAAVTWSAIIFGVVHAPGLYVRGAHSEGISHQLPLLYWICFSIAYMSVAGFFLGVIWQRTKNILLLIALHAIFDLVPNLKEFISAWHIQ